MSLFGDFNSSVPIPFQRLRAVMLEQGGGIQEGVLGSGDLKVSQRGAGANLSADVAVGAAWIVIDTGSRNGAAHIYSDAVFNAGPFSAGHATLPRVDQVIVRWNDSSIPTGTGNTPTIEVLTGTATSGAQISNTAGANYRAGATALPNDCLRVADVLMPALASSVTTANIVDRRPWARGAFWTFSKASSPPAASTGFADIDATNMKPRIECSGSPVLVTLSFSYSPVGANTLFGQITVDGASVADRRFGTVASTPETMHISEVITPAAGSHIIAYQHAESGATGSVLASSNQPMVASFIEQVRVNASNT